MRKRTIARVLAVVLGAALALGALAGCQSPATGATDQQQANRTYMTKVNQAVEELNTRLGEFDEAVAQESVVNMRNKANSAFEAIDALAARSVRRLGTTIQLTDTGIHPGSGVGNHRHSLTRESLGVPVLAIGVPTVVGAAAIVHDTVSALIRVLADNDKTKGTGSWIEDMDSDQQYQLINPGLPG